MGLEVALCDVCRRRCCRLLCSVLLVASPSLVRSFTQAPLKLDRGPGLPVNVSATHVRSGRLLWWWCCLCPIWSRRQTAERLLWCWCCLCPIRTRRQTEERLQCWCCLFPIWTRRQTVERLLQCWCCLFPIWTRRQTEEERLPIFLALLGGSGVLLVRELWLWILGFALLLYCFALLLYCFALLLYCSALLRVRTSRRIREL